MKVVALTANAITGMKEKYLSEGFDDYLAKPIEKQELTRVLNKFLK
jgi:CheY-like chemotaxis protein